MGQISITCPNCGATTNKTDYCEFCGSFLVGKLVKGVDVGRYADTVRQISLDDGLRKVLEIFTNIINHLSDKHGKLLNLRILDIKNKCKEILLISASKKDLILTYSHSGFGEFANSSMFPLFEKKKENYIVTFGKDYEGAVKLITQFIRELYPNADLSYEIKIWKPSEDKEELGYARYNRNGMFIDGTFVDSRDDDDEEYSNEREISSAEFTPESIESLIKVEDEICKKEKNKEIQKNNIDAKLTAKLRDKKFSDSIKSLKINIGNSVTAHFYPDLTSIRLQVVYNDDDRIYFEDLGHKKAYESYMDQKPYYKYGEWHIEQSYSLYSSDLKKIAESSEELELWIKDSWGNRKWMSTNNLKGVISNIWSVVNSPSDDTYKLLEESKKKRAVGFWMRFFGVILFLGGLVLVGWGLEAGEPVGLLGLLAGFIGLALLICSCFLKTK